MSLTVFHYFYVVPKHPGFLTSKPVWVKTVWILVMLSIINQDHLLTNFHVVLSLGTLTDALFASLLERFSSNWNLNLHGWFRAPMDNWRWRSIRQANWQCSPFQDEAIQSNEQTEKTCTESRSIKTCNYLHRIFKTDAIVLLLYFIILFISTGSATYSTYASCLI